MNIFLINIAQAFTLSQPIPKISGEGGLTTANTFAEYVVGIMPYVFGLAVVIAVVQLVIGGMEYALSEGLTKKEDAKGRIWAAIGGLMLALLSWLILNTINPDFVNPKALNIQALPNTPGAPAGGTIFSSGAGGNTCTGGGGCVSGICNAGTCAPVATNRPSGASCGQHSQCTSGSCTFKTPPGSFTCD